MRVRSGRNSHKPAVIFLEISSPVTGVIFVLLLRRFVAFLVHETREYHIPGTLLLLVK